MRIGFDTQILATNLTGTNTYARNLLKALQEAGDSHEIVPLQPDRRTLASGRLAAKLVNAVLDFAYLQCWYPYAACREKLDLVHYPANLLPLIGNTRQVVTIHDMSFVLCPDSYDLLFRLYFRVFVPLSARNADCVITDSQASRQDICRICKVSPEKVIVVPLGVTPDWFALNDSDTLSANIPEHIRNHRFVLAIGELTPRKNLARLIQAFAHLTRQALPYIPHLVLVGPAIRKLHKQHADRLKMQLEADGSEDRVHFLGVVPQSTLVALMRRAEALAFVSLHEGFGLPILEAMACGTPVLSSAVSSMPEVAGEAALLVNPKDVSEIADGLRRILFDQPLRQVLVEKGIARVKQFTWERTARGTIAVYRNVIERSSFDKTPRGALGDEQ